MRQEKAVRAAGQARCRGPSPPLRAWTGAAATARCCTPPVCVWWGARLPRGATFRPGGPHAVWRSGTVEARRGGGPLARAYPLSAWPTEAPLVVHPPAHARHALLHARLERQGVRVAPEQPRHRDELPALLRVQIHPVNDHVAPLLELRHRGGWAWVGKVGESVGEWVGEWVWESGCVAGAAAPASRAPRRTSRESRGCLG